MIVSRFNGQGLINNDDVQLVNINIKPNKDLLILNVHNRNFTKNKEKEFKVYISMKELLNQICLI